MNYALFYLLIISTTLVSSCSIERQLEKQREQNGIDLPFVYLKRDTLRNAHFENAFYYDMKKKDSVEITVNYMPYVVFAGQTEVTNRQYNVFLNSLKNDSLFDLYEACKPYEKGWLLLDSLNPFFIDLYNAYHSSEKYLDFPVVNITPGAMREYVSWLNRMDPTDVTYKLPNEDDWISGFNDLDVSDSSYAWGTKSYKNQNDLPLGNFTKLDEEQIRYDPIKDHLWFDNFDEIGYEILINGPLDVHSYNPNYWGAYCFSGNVAEYIEQRMNYIAEDSIYLTKGGSWFSPPYSGRKNAFEEYVLPSPCVGFRVYRYEVRWNEEF